MNDLTPQDQAELDKLLARIEEKETPMSSGPASSDTSAGSNEVTEDLLGEIVNKLERYVVFTNHAQVTAISLWILNTHVFELFDSTPYLNISSASKQCGKSRLFEVIALMVARPWTVVEVSEAVLFRKIDQGKPTLMLDEIDAMFGKDSTMTEGIRAVLNAGYRRGAVVPRCTGPTNQLKDFGVYCPKAFAGIGAKLPDTVIDRSISVELRRRAPSERMPSRFRQRPAGIEFAPLHLRIVQWSEWASEELKDSQPELPEALTDRQQDTWEPLFAIADLAGGEWPDRARSAAIALHGGLPDADVGVLLLAHCKQVKETSEGDSLSTEDLLTALINRGDDSPWARWWSDDIEHRQTKRPGSQLARRLKPYGIEPQQMKITGVKTRGYRWADFEDAWSRYLPNSNGTVTMSKYNGTTVPRRSEPIFGQTPLLAKSASDQDGTVVPSKKSTDTVPSGNRMFSDDDPPLTDADFHGFGDGE